MNIELPCCLSQLNFMKPIPYSYSYMLFYTISNGMYSDLN